MDSQPDETPNSHPRVHHHRPNTRLVCFHLHKPTPARPFGKHGSFFLSGGQCICCGLNRASVPLSREFVRK